MSTDLLKWERVSWSETRDIPCKPGCYALLDKNENVLYIGRSKMLWNRLRNPATHKGFKRKQVPDEDTYIAWCCGWDVYDKEKELILCWNPPLSVN